MALPKFNTAPFFDEKVPSTGKRITYRPYLVKEEKILMMAFESQDQKQVTRAIGNTLNSCIKDDIDVFKLTTFDVEFIFITLRSKSVGEGIKLTPKCLHCDEINEVTVDLEQVKVNNLDDMVDKHVKLTDDISIDLKWHTMKDRHDKLEGETETETVINMIVASLDTIYSGEEIFNCADSPRKEVLEFVESLNTDQFGKIIEVLGKAPYLSYDVKFNCKE